MAGVSAKSKPAAAAKAGKQGISANAEPGSKLKSDKSKLAGARAPVARVTPLAKAASGGVKRASAGEGAPSARAAGAKPVKKVQRSATAKAAPAAIKSTAKAPVTGAKAKAPATGSKATTKAPATGSKVTTKAPVKKRVRISEEPATKLTQPKRARAGDAAAKPAAKRTRVGETPANKVTKAKRAEPESEEQDGDDGEFVGFPDEEDEGGSEEGDEEEDEEGENAHLEGFSDEDSAAEEEEDDALASRGGAPVDEVVRMPSSRDEAAVRQRLDRVNKKLAAAPPERTGVVYVGRLPHGFFEHQLRAYFSQFGDIKRLRLSRNRKTGHSKHYAFIEFASEEVAEIVVDTMNNYLLDGHLLQMSLIPAEEVDPNTWVGANRKYRTVPADRMERLRRHKQRTPEQQERVNRKLLQRQTQRRKKLERAGIEYDFPGYQI